MNNMYKASWLTYVNISAQMKCTEQCSHCSIAYYVVSILLLLALCIVITLSVCYVHSVQHSITLLRNLLSNRSLFKIHVSIILNSFIAKSKKIIRKHLTILIHSRDGENTSSFDSDHCLSTAFTTLISPSQKICGTCILA